MVLADGSGCGWLLTPQRRQHPRPPRRAQLGQLGLQPRHLPAQLGIQAPLALDLGREPGVLD
jgi:hypothetical protein